MDNRDLFKFEFVNRVKQREKISAFFSKKMQSNIMWMYGQHGVGKTFLLDYVMKKFNGCYVYAEIKPEDRDPNVIYLLLSALQEKFQLDFISFFKENYINIIELFSNILDSQKFMPPYQ